MLTRVSCTLLIIIALVIIDINCDFCSDKKSRKLRDFDGTRQNFMSLTDDSCAINYFDIDSISQLTLSNVRNAALLRNLNLSANRISTIHNDTFNQLVGLENLVLGDNFLTEIRSHYFNGLKELSSLDLSSNLILNVDENSFIMLGSLLWLSLANNCIVNLALNLPLVELVALNLSHNLIENWPHFKSIGAIDTVDLSHNTNGILNVHIEGKFSEIERQKIARFAKRITQSIKSLNIADNEISNLTRVQSFINLDELNLAGNPINYAANVFPRLVQLRKLNLSATNLTSLEGFRSIDPKKLTLLSIGKNPLKADFDSLRKYSNLRQLYMSTNFCSVLERHREIRENFINLTHVEVLYNHSDCECAERNRDLLALHNIKFSTDWHHVCSAGQSSWSKRRQNGIIYNVQFIVFYLIWELMGI